MSNTSDHDRNYRICAFCFYDELLSTCSDVKEEYAFEKIDQALIP